MKLEEMKSAWSGLNARMDNIETDINQLKFDKMKTAQQQLVNQYRVFACVSAMFIGFSCIFFSRIFDNVWLELSCAIFFAISATMDLVLQHKVGEINLTAMPVIEVAEKAVACRRLHHISQLILIPLVIVLLAFMAYTMTDNKAFIYGMCAGGAIGLAFGLKGYFKFMDNYKSLIKG